MTREDGVLDAPARVEWPGWLAAATTDMQMVAAGEEQIPSPYCVHGTIVLRTSFAISLAALVDDTKCSSRMWSCD